MKINFGSGGYVSASTDPEIVKIIQDASDKIKMLEAENEWLWDQHHKFKEFRQLIADAIMKIERD